MATNIEFVIVYKELFIIGVYFIDQHKGCKQQSLIKGIKPYNALFDCFLEEILKTIKYSVSSGVWGHLACVQTITKLWLVPSAKQRRDPCSGPPTDSTNYRKYVSNSPSTWLAITTNKIKAFFNWPIVARTQIWEHSWNSRTRISALFRRQS